MAQIFSPGADSWLRVVLLLAAVGVVAAFLLAGGILRSDWRSGVGFAPHQPVPFSHQHHVGQLGLDCRYCHAAVENSRHAGFPATETCMTCHSQLFTDAEMLAPLRDSLASGQPLRWARVAQLPGYVYFDHAVHLAQGVGCSTCHGRVDRMPLAYRARAFDMDFCLSCHRDPALHLRAGPQEVFDMAWTPPPDQRRLGEERMAERGIAGRDITHCATCHR